MVTGHDIVTTAREYLGTPFFHQARLKGVGVDCIGLLACVAKDLGLSFKDRTNYPRYPDARTLMEEAANSPLYVVPIDRAQEGDVFLFWIRRASHPQHAAIYTGPNPHTIIHSAADFKAVIESRLDYRWVKRIAGVYRWAELMETV